LKSESENTCCAEVIFLFFLSSQFLLFLFSSIEIWNQDFDFCDYSWRKSIWSFKSHEMLYVKLLSYLKGRLISSKLRMWIWKKVILNFNLLNNENCLFCRFMLCVYCVSDVIILMLVKIKWLIKVTSMSWTNLWKLK
jgi:hypothetical protein